jgi:hypothetical protein
MRALHLHRRRLPGQLPVLVHQGCQLSCGLQQRLQRACQLHGAASAPLCCKRLAAPMHRIQAD